MAQVADRKGKNRYLSVCKAKGPPEGDPFRRSTPNYLREIRVLLNKQPDRRNQTPQTVTKNLPQIMAFALIVLSSQNEIAFSQDSGRNR